MKILIIDSHKSSNDQPQQNLHWTNAKILADELIEATLNTWHEMAKKEKNEVIKKIKDIIER